MAITARQRAARASGIGASEVPALFGRHPYLSRADLRLLKLGLVSQEPDEAPGPWGTSNLALIGTLKEPALASVVEACTGLRLVKPKGTYRHAGGILFANVDRQVGRAARGSIIVELKDTGIDEGWGEPGTDEVPPHVLIQVCTQILCAGAPEAMIARESHGRRRSVDIYRVQNRGIISEMIGAIAEEAGRFWDRYILNRQPLPASDPPPSPDLLSRLPLEAGLIAAIDPDLVDEWEKWKALSAEIEPREKDARARVLAQIGTAAEGQFRGGRISVSMSAPKPVLCPKCAAIVSQRDPYRILKVKKDPAPCHPAHPQQLPRPLLPATTGTETPV